MHVPKVRKARWSHDERVLVAREEIWLLEVGATNVNFELAALFTQRSLDALKSVRRTAAYIAVCDRLRGRAPDQPPPAQATSTQSDDSPAGLPTAHEQAGELAPATTLTPRGPGLQWKWGPLPHQREETYATLWETGLASWSDEELQNLARAELRALKLHPGGHNINQLLRGVVPCRSFDAMKGTRRTTK